MPARERVESPGPAIQGDHRLSRSHVVVHDRSMRRFGLAGLAMLAFVVFGCSSSAGWHGKNIHLVDGFRSGTERACRDDADNLRCRRIVAEALRLIGPERLAFVARAQLAELP